MSSNPAPPNPNPNGREPLSPAVRRRVQMCFQSGTQSAAKNDFKYATEMFMQCIKWDPANQIYAKAFLDIQSKKYNNNRKGAGFTSAPRINLLKGSIKTSEYKKDWPSVMQTGVEVLTLNPWDVSTLSAMARACDALNFDEAQLVYWKYALEVDSKDPDVNRSCGRILARIGAFDQADACWRRVLAAKPGDEEANRAIGDLAIEKTISHGGYEGAENSTDVMADKAAKADRRSDATARLSPEQQLERSIAKKPEDVSLYIELADLHAREEQHQKCIDVLKRALEVSGGELSVRERLEDAQLRAGRHQLAIAEKRAKSEKTPEAIDLYKRMKAEVNSIELQVYRTRSERYPNSLGLKFDLGKRLKSGTQYKEAITCFQAALGDAKRKPTTHMELGECFQFIKQYKLAMQNYEAALEAISPREIDARKIALYRAGRLALALAEKHLADGDAHGKDELQQAEKYLNELAGLEFSYKDVPELLDKIAKIRHKG